MEDAARLALIERSVNNKKIYEKLLNEFLLLLNHILEDPHDYEFRRVVNDTLQDSCENYEDFCDYLKYLGFVWKDGEYVLPMEKKLDSLKQSKTAVERKIMFCFGPQNHTSPNVRQLYKKKTSLLKPVDVLTTDNSFLLSIQRLFNDVLKYEDESLQEMARRLIPMTTLEMRAVERMREFQKKIKTGEVKDYDLSYDMALLAELLSWFKHMFFSWVDKPPCPECGGTTKLSRKRSMTVRGETCLVEGFDCTECRKGTVEFPRHNDPRNLLVTRRGRCGEFTNCFALMCRSLGYDTRYVCDNADHVWCEVFDYDSNSWIHVDPSECKMNAPLMYAHGWNKQLSYVIAASRDDVQDVTWRYTTNFKEVLKRRRACSEQALVGALLALREARQRHVSAPRRRHLAARTLRELVRLMHERRPEESEWQGRLSGSLEWRQTRGELGKRRARHVFTFDKPGECSVRYCSALDRYLVTRDGVDVDKMASWSAGAFEFENVFRKVEADWEQVYLAREEGALKGMVSWKIAVADAHQHLVFDHISIDATVALYENGEIEWTVQFDDEEPVKVTVGERTCALRRRYRTCVVRARLSGGRGEVGWQHAQVLRQPLHSTADAIHIRARLTSPPAAKV